MRALEIADMNASDVSTSIGEDRKQLSTRIGRLKRGARENIDLDAVVAYAKAMRVSVAWLCAGVGDPWDGPYAVPEPGSVQDLPDVARRAVAAAVALDELHETDAILAARAVRDEMKSNASPRDWMAAIRGYVSLLSEEVSGRADARKSRTRASGRRSSR